MHYNDAIKRRLGQPDSRSMKGIFSRGKNVYRGTSFAAHSGGGPQFGRPRKGSPAPTEDVYSFLARIMDTRRG